MQVREAYRDIRHEVCYPHWHGDLPLPASAPVLGPVESVLSHGCEFCDAERATARSTTVESVTPGKS